MWYYSLRTEIHAFAYTDLKTNKNHQYSRKMKYFAMNEQALLSLNNKCFLYLIIELVYKLEAQFSHILTIA